jgi:hypothetical protein
MPSGISSDEYPSSSMRRAVAIHCSGPPCGVATTPKLNGLVGTSMTASIDRLQSFDV